MQILSHSIDKKLRDIINSINDLLLLTDWSQPVINFIFVFSRHQVWNLTSVQQIIEILNK